MKLRFLGKESTPTNSPTLYASDQDSFVVQGWIVADATVLSGLTIEPDETVVEVPAGLMDHMSADGLAGAIEFSMTQLERAPFEAGRRTIDVSGDGTNNAGRDVKLARDEALAKGVAINGLVILSEHPLSWNAEHTNPPGGLDRYYQNNVVGGPGAFVMVAQNFNSFGQAIMNKMIAEIAAARQPRYAALQLLLVDPARAVRPVSFRSARTE